MPIGTKSRMCGILTVILLIAAVAVGAAGCSSDVDPLDGTSWKLVEWTLSSLDPADFTITAAFADGRISGTSGVNGYSGPYTVSEDDAFSAGPFEGTLMAGPEPEMRAESAYLTLLGQAGSYRMSNGNLTLYDQGGNESLIFEAAG